MKKILFFEFSRSHSEFLYSQILYLQKFNYEVYLWMSESSHMNLPESVELKEIKRFPTAKKLDSVKTTRRLKKYLKNNGIDKVIINTAHGSFIRNLVIGLFFSPIELIGILHFGEKISGSFTQKIISMKIKKYFIPNDYIRKCLPTNTNLKFCEFFYLTFTDKVYQREENHEELQVAIPGAIEYSRRDYDGFLGDVAKNIDHLNKIKFIFLGNCSTEEGEKLQHKAKSLGIEKICVFFQGYVPQDEFYYQISQADLIMPLIHPNVKWYDSFTKYSVSGAYSLAFGYKFKTASR